MSLYRLRVKVHALPGTPEVPAADLTALFETAGVSFGFEAGERLQEDPGSWLAYLDLLRAYEPVRPGPGAPAHLFVGKTWRGPGLDQTNGILLNRERGAVAVFTASAELARDGAPAFLQTCAHELAHLLNLTHAQGIPSIPTIECPASLRAGRDLALAWSAAGGGRPAQRAFPLSRHSHEALRGLAAEWILPWGNEFIDSAAGVVDAAPSPLPR